MKDGYSDETALSPPIQQREEVMALRNRLVNDRAILDLVLVENHNLVEIFR